MLSCVICVRAGARSQRGVTGKEFRLAQFQSPQTLQRFWTAAAVKTATAGMRGGLTEITWADLV